jgi:hypothetical protein
MIGFSYKHIVNKPATCVCCGNLLNSMFQGCLISIKNDIPWSVHFIDLISCNYFLWGYAKFQVHKYHPRNLEALKKAIITVY